jgi:curved DNA-binding protein CbpA
MSRESPLDDEASSGQSTEANPSPDEFQYDNYYDLLGVDVDASESEITTAFRKKSREYHPDMSSLPKEEAERRFQEIVEAREVLGTFETRQAYDQLGHQKYIQQTQELGEKVRNASIDEDDSDSSEQVEANEAEGVVQDDPTAVSADGTVTDGHTSPIGEAHKSGDAVAESRDDVFVSEPSSPADSADESSSSIYPSLFETKEQFKSTSIMYIRRQWRTTWINRTLYTFFTIGFVMIGLSALTVGLEQVGMEVSLQSYTTDIQFIFGLALFAAVSLSFKANLYRELRFPKGGFVNDRNLTRFSTHAAGRYNRVGVLLLITAAALLVSGGRSGSIHPWEYTAGVFQGNFPGVFPWFDLSTIGADGYTLALDIIISLIFVSFVFTGMVLVTVGVSVSAWISRYHEGTNIRPSVWESVFVLSGWSITFALLFGNIQLFNSGAAGGLSGPVASILAVSGSTVTIGTFAGIGVFACILTPLLYRIRLAISSYLE